MNRIVLIGNGFDKAHGLHTGYEDFIYWYWKKRARCMLKEETNESKDVLCTLVHLKEDSWRLAYYYDSVLKMGEGKEVYQYLNSHPNTFRIIPSEFFDSICQSIETKKWVDIENEYYELLKKYALKEKDETKVKELNEQLYFLQDNLVEYLSYVNQNEVKPIENIKNAIYRPFLPDDISIGGFYALQEHIEGGIALDDHGWRLKLEEYSYNNPAVYSAIQEFREVYQHNQDLINRCPRDLYEIIYPHLGLPRYLLPNEIMLLNFNYTDTAELYCSKDKDIFYINHIHGEVSSPESVIFGYGDEIDEEYKELVKKNDNNCLSNIKSIKYLESDNYRKVLSFIESEPYQILIMGHSCGNSDRTLLNTLFEHRNCVSIKPYFYINNKGKDNYIEIVQNISRNFTDMKLMRDRVVNKLYCEPLTKKDSQESDQ